MKMPKKNSWIHVPKCHLYSNCMYIELGLLIERWGGNQSKKTAILRSKIKSFIDGAADWFDNRRDVERVPSAILLLANCRLVNKFLYLCLKCQF